MTEQSEYEQFLAWKHSGGMQQQAHPRRSLRDRQADWFADRLAATPEGQEAILRVADRIRAEQQGQPKQRVQQQPHVVVDYPTDTPAAPPRATPTARPQAPTPPPLPQPSPSYDEGFAQDLGF